MGFPRILSGLPFPSPEDLPDPGIEPETPMSPELAGGFLSTASSGKSKVGMLSYYNVLTLRFDLKTEEANIITDSHA